ncbi:hypothetical protein EVAR_47905_1 [Eumeta japonica]|uniref:Uncharacterized protein n=1 Tax=Eumeta variegata TaxID=151549 RepID=A0A4C1YBE3_EUMVA|nr:hypothetical protein EVAR_47905_1 [Eumeta japonica]
MLDICQSSRKSVSIDLIEISSRRTDSRVGVYSHSPARVDIECVPTSFVSSERAVNDDPDLDATFYSDSKPAFDSDSDIDLVSGSLRNTDKNRGRRRRTTPAWTTRGLSGSRSRILLKGYISTPQRSDDENAPSLARNLPFSFRGDRVTWRLKFSPSALPPEVALPAEVGSGPIRTLRECNEQRFRIPVSIRAAREDRLVRLRVYYLFV